jgi:site-specific DNA-methyltransferase (adenine-specific)
MQASEVRFVKGRLKFGDGSAPAPFPSAIIVFRPGQLGSPRFSAVACQRAFKDVRGGGCLA